jgi:hypothetical protein
MTGEMGLLVDAVGNFDGSAFVPSKNQGNGARREREFIFESAEASRERRCQPRPVLGAMRSLRSLLTSAGATRRQQRASYG